MKLFAEKRKYFPDPLNITIDEIVAVDDQINTEILLEAYSFGIFPWPHEEYPILWHFPKERGVLFFEDLHISKSLTKFLKNHDFTVTYNKAFDQVINECAKAKRKNQSGTWIDNRVLKPYIQFHKDGYAHSVEVWQEGELVGGIYGVYVGGVFSGESMFHKVDNASKFALLKLIDLLKANNLAWLDVQMVTPLLEAFGAKYMDSISYYELLMSSRGEAKPLLINGE